MPKDNPSSGPVILLILDGWGISKETTGNAIKLAKTPFYDSLISKYPLTELRAHGKYVGLPQGQVGNSEAGHMNIGAGRVVEQDVVKINRLIKEGEFFQNSVFKKALKNTQKNNSNLHLMGLLSDKMSPHSSTEHILALLKLAREKQANNIYLHLFTDGRDSFPYEAIKLISRLEKKLRKNEKIATVMGRFYAMDRNKKWQRTKRAYEALVSGKACLTGDLKNAISRYYTEGITDEYIKPLIPENLASQSRIQDKDSVIFFNLRSDRARQLSKPFVQKNFLAKNQGAFKREKTLKNIVFVAMTNFGPDLGSILTAFPEEPLKKTLPEVARTRQIYLAESEKYAHVTYFFNGGHKNKLGKEEYFMVPSPKVRSYADTPAMKTPELSRELIKRAQSGKYDVIVLNLAAPDMVGHTGNLQAAIKCCEVVDENLAKIVPAILKAKAKLLITADHGNIEKLIDLETGKINTKHTTNPVPLLLISPEAKNYTLRKGGALSDISPTLLDLLNLEKPRLMSGESLIFD